MNISQAVSLGIALAFSSMSYAQSANEGCVRVYCKKDAPPGQAKFYPGVKRGDSFLIKQNDFNNARSDCKLSADVKILPGKDAERIESWPIWSDVKSGGDFLDLSKDNIMKCSAKGRK